jgi:predicted Fe-Mo cluster-binding NifX family protein
MTSETDPRFGRARCFVVVDTETGEHEAVDNAMNLNAAQGAGVQAAETVARMAVDAVATGHCGPKAFRVLSAAGIKVYTGVEGTVEAAVDKLKTGEYREAEAPDVESHW